VVTLVNGVTRVVIHLSPTEGEGQIGTAVFNSVGDSTTVEISVEPQTTDAQPIHIHSGICTDVGAVRHALQNVVRGSSVTVIDLSLKEIISDGALVNVHESYTHASNYTACGQIPLDLP
jgi:citrate lyase gamma subunit